MLWQWCKATWKARRQAAVGLALICAGLAGVVGTAGNAACMLAPEIPASFQEGRYTHARGLVRGMLPTGTLPVRLFVCQNFEGLRLLSGRWPGPGEIVTERSSRSLFSAAVRLNLRLTGGLPEKWRVVGEVWDPTQAPGQMDRVLYCYTKGSAPAETTQPPPREHAHATHMRGVVAALTMLAVTTLLCGSFLLASVGQRMVLEQEAECQLLRALGADWRQVRRWVTGPLLGLLGLAGCGGALASQAVTARFMAFARQELNLDTGVPSFTSGPASVFWLLLLLLGPGLACWLSVGRALTSPLEKLTPGPAPGWFRRLPVGWALCWGGLLQQRRRALWSWLGLTLGGTLWVVAVTVGGMAWQAVSQALEQQPWNCEIVGLGQPPTAECWSWASGPDEETLGTASPGLLGTLPLASGRLPLSRREFAVNGAWLANHAERRGIVGVVRELGPPRRYLLDPPSLKGWVWRGRGSSPELQARVRDLLAQGRVILEARGAEENRRAATEHAFIFSVILGALGAMFFGLGCLSLLFHLERSLQQRRPEVYCLWAMGTSPGLVRRSLGGEAMTLYLLAAAGSLALGIPLGAGLVTHLVSTSLHIPVPFSLPWTGLMVGFAAGAAVVGLAVPKSPGLLLAKFSTPS